MTNAEFMGWDDDWYTKVDIASHLFEILTGYPVTICHRPECNYWVKVTGWGHNSGFAGEGFSWETYSCGHSLVSEGHYYDD